VFVGTICSNVYIGVIMAFKSFSGFSSMWSRYRILF
jgi:hypothetical protein